MTRIVHSFGASVRGPLHKCEKHPNEDAWLRTNGRFGSLIVVCDGMGSKSNARVGAREACLAVREAVIRWDKADGASLSTLTDLIESLWQIRISPDEARDSATTCLFALARSEGEWVIGGIGDGLAAIKNGSNRLDVIIGDRGEGFGNVTTALGIRSHSDKWKVASYNPDDVDRAVILATDGVADDLIAEKLEAFVSWLIEEFKALSPTDRWRTLSRYLRNWPTPHHLDDKSLAVLFTSGYMGND